MVKPLQSKAITLLLEGKMKDIENNIAEELKSDTNFEFNTSDSELFKRATITANNQQGTKDLVALGMASLWVVFVSLFMKILQPIFKQMAKNTKTKKDINNTTNQGSK